MTVLTNFSNTQILFLGQKTVFYDSPFTLSVYSPLVPRIRFKNTITGDAALGVR